MVDSQKPLCESIIHEIDRQLLSFFNDQLKQEYICSQYDQNIGFKDGGAQTSYFTANKELPIYLPLIDHQIEREHNTGQQRFKDTAAPQEKEFKNETSDGSVPRQDSFSGSRTERGQRDPQYSTTDRSFNDAKSNASKLFNFQLRNRLNELFELQQQRLFNQEQDDAFFRKEKFLKIVQTRIYQNGDTFIYFNQPFLKDYLYDLERQADMKIQFKIDKTQHLYNLNSEKQKDHIIEIPLSVAKERKCEQKHFNRLYLNSTQDDERRAGCSNGGALGANKTTVAQHKDICASFLPDSVQSNIIKSVKKIDDFEIYQNKCKSILQKIQDKQIRNREMRDRHERDREWSRDRERERNIHMQKHAPHKRTYEQLVQGHQGSKQTKQKDHLKQYEINNKANMLDGFSAGPQTEDYDIQNNHYDDS